MKNVLAPTSVLILLLIGIVIGYHEVCKDPCDLDAWAQTITLYNVDVDFDENGKFHGEEYRREYKIARSELAFLTMKETGGRYVYIYQPDHSEPTYRVRVESMITFIDDHILKEHLECCYLRVQSQNHPKFKVSYIRFDMIEQAFINKGYKLEVTVKDIGKFTIHRERAKIEKARIDAYNTCNCE